jgi:hypothetical protein
MDGSHFDRMLRSLAVGGSRRGLLRRIAATTLGAALGRAVSAETLACARNGKRCDPKQPSTCCSGTCGKSHRCKPAKGAQGCTIDDNICVGQQRRCPGNHNGECVVLDSGKPFCIDPDLGDCHNCATEADCDAAFGLSGGRCVTNCPFCAISGVTRACVFPQQPG